jgi:hypothetical protein
MNVFISHSHRDHEIVERIAAGLRQRGVDVWLDHDFVAPGEQWADKINEACEKSDAVLVILSGNTPDSRFQNSEIAFAIASQRHEPKKQVIPVLVDPSADVPFFLRNLVYCDLTPEGDFEASIDALVRALLREHEAASDLDESDQRRIDLVKAGSEMLCHEARALNATKLLRTFTIVTGVIALIVSLSSIMVVWFFGQSVLRRLFCFEVGLRTPDFLAGFLVGLLSSAVALVVASAVRAMALRRQDRQ